MESLREKERKGQEEVGKEGETERRKGRGKRERKGEERRRERRRREIVSGGNRLVCTVQVCTSL